MKTLIYIALLFLPVMSYAQIDIVPTNVRIKWRSYDPSGTVGTDYLDSSRASFGDGVIDTSGWVHVDSIGGLGTYITIASPDEDTCATLVKVQWGIVSHGGLRAYGVTTSLDSLVNEVHTGATTRFYATDLWTYAKQNGGTWFRFIIPDPTTIGMWGTGTSDGTGTKRIPHIEATARYPRY